MGIYIGIAALVVIMVLFYVFTSKTKHKANKQKVVSMNAYKQADAGAGAQKCSYCKKLGKLTFYADHNGTVVGLCKECKPIAEQKEMFPI